MYRYIIFFLVIVCFTTCKKNKTSQSALDEKTITEYMANHNLSGKATGSGLYYVIKTQGTGAQPTSSSKVKIDYIGYTTIGTIFDLSPSGGTVSDLSSTIKGWQEGIPYFKKGAKGTLLIPSALGYGSHAQGTIPANSVLIFDITLIDIVN